MKLLAFVLMASLLIVATGCPTQNTSTAFNPFVGGTEGITVEFQPSNPPNEIPDRGQQVFGVGVILKNKGEHSFDPTTDFGKITLLGINPAYFGNPQTEKVIDFSMKGVNKNFDGKVLDGDTQFYTFENFNYMNDLAGNDVLKLRAQICYDYQTKTSTKICIKENKFETKTSSADLCLINEVKEPKNSGGPIHVTSLSEQPTGQNKVQVLFVISHVGKGTFYKIGSANLCDDSVTNTDKNKVYVSVSLPAGTDATLNCQGLTENQGTAGFITLYEGADRTLTCTIDMGTEKKVYEPILSIDLDYLYSDSVTKEITVLDVGQ
jgi:hypothetical protein